MLTEDQIKKMLQNPAATDWSKLSASDVGMQIGKPMTEEEMREYCKKNNIQPKIVKKKD
jgi:hypothetical protein